MDELQRDSEAVLIAMETEESRQLVEALLVGRPAGMTEVVGRLVGTYIQGQCHDWNAVQKDLAPRFFQHFREKYVHPDFAAGRQALERDVAWATLQQGETIQALVVSLGAGMAEQFDKFQAQLNRIESQGDRCDTARLRFAWIEDYFREVLQQLAQIEDMQAQSLAQGVRIEETLAQMRAILAISPEELARLRGMEQEADALRAELAAKEAQAAILAAKLPAGAGLEAEALAATAHGDYREADRLYALMQEPMTRDLARIKQQRGDNAFRAHHWMDAARFYSEAYALDPTDERNDQCGYLYALIGQSGSALPYLDRSVRRLNGLREQREPQGQWSPEYRNDLAKAYMNRGVAQRSVPDPDAAIQDYASAISIMEDLQATLEPLGQWNPPYRKVLAGAYINRGIARQDVPDISSAIQDYGASISILEGLRQALEPQGQWNPQYRNDLAAAYMNRAVAQRGVADLNAAIQDNNAAIEIREGLRQALELQGQWNPQYRNDLAMAYMNRGNAQQGAADLNAAIQDYGAAIAIMEGLRQGLEPQGQWNPPYRNGLAGAYMNRGNARQGVPDLNAAIQDYGAAIAIREDLRKQLEPEGQWNPEYRNDLAMAYMNRGNAQQDIPDLNAAIQDCGAAIGIREGLRASLEPQGQWNPEYRNDLAMAYMNRGVAQQDIPDLNAAIQDCGAAIEIMEDLRQALEPQGQWNPEYRNDLALARANLAEALLPANRDRARDEAHQAVAIFEDLTRIHPITAWPAFFRQIYVFALETRAAAHRALGQDDLAAEDERRAREIPD